MAKSKGKAGGGGAKRATARSRPRIIKVTTLKILWENRFLGLIGTVPIPRPKGMPVKLVIDLPAKG